MVEDGKVRSWRAYLMEMLDEALEAPDLTPPVRDALLELRDRYSSEINSLVPVLLETPLPPHLMFLSKYPEDLRDRTLRRLKAEKPIA